MASYKLKITNERANFTSGIAKSKKLGIVLERRSATLCLSKHHIFSFINFGSKVMATTCIGMVCNHYSSMCFFDFVWSSIIPAKPEKNNRSLSEQKIENKVGWVASVKSSVIPKACGPKLSLIRETQPVRYFN